MRVPSPKQGAPETLTVVRNVYDASGRVSDQYDALGNGTTFAYDEPSHLTRVTDPRNNTTTYQYDGDWRLTSERYRQLKGIDPTCRFTNIAASNAGRNSANCT